MTFMSQGVRVVELLVKRWIKTRQHVLRRAEAIAQLFGSSLVGGAVRFFSETVEEAPDAAMIIDCTVCQIKRPKRPFEEAKVFFSGKHFIYALKKEVCVNVRSGTAALVSKAYPGSVHDITILRDHSRTVNNILGGRAILDDLGYRGAQRDVQTIAICDGEDEQLRSKSVLVECFFGRLKMLWSVFSSKWTLGEEFFDTFFDIGCALTNLDVLHRPLRLNDQVFNEGVLNMILHELKIKADRQREANERYLGHRREVLGLEDNEHTVEDW